MADIDYKAIAEELRAITASPDPSMPPGEYVVATALTQLARAIDGVAQRSAPPKPKKPRWMIRRYAFALPWYVFEFDHSQGCYWTDPGMQFASFDGAIVYINTRRTR